MINTLIILCGSPGSGKTTLSKQIAEEQNAIRLSFDEMWCLQHKELLPHIVQSLGSGQSVVVDALYTRTSWREAVLDAIEHIPCKKILIYVNTPLEECVHRNARRENPLPEFMVRDIYNSFEPPSSDEGWDEIREVKTYETNFTSN